MKDTGFQRLILTGVVTAALSSCNGGSGGNGGGGISPSAFICSPVGGGNATAQTSCVTCPTNAISNKLYAIDTNLDSFAGISLFQPGSSSNQQGDISLRATAQSGVVFPAGSRAGLIFGLPTGQNVRYSATVLTYLNGTQQESRQVVVGNTGATHGEIQYFGFDSTVPTTLQFNAVEITITETLPNLERHDYRAFEFCSDGVAQ